MIADCGQGEGERGQPLLAVDDEPAGERRLVLRRRRQHNGPQEVRVRLLSMLDQLGLLQDVAPQLFELLLRPGVRPLIERYLELLGPPCTRSANSGRPGRGAPAARRGPRPDDIYRDLVAVCKKTTAGLGKREDMTEDDMAAAVIRAGLRIALVTGPD